MKHIVRPLTVLAVLLGLCGCNKQETASAPAAAKPSSSQAAQPAPSSSPESESAEPGAPASGSPDVAKTSAPNSPRAHVWTSTDGRTMEADLIWRSQDSFKIRRVADGREFTLQLASVVQADRDYVNNSSIPLTAVKRFDSAKLAELQRQIPKLQPDAPLDANDPLIVDLFGRYERDIKAITEVGFDRHIRMLRDRMEADLKRIEAVAKTTVRNPPVLTQFGWTKGSGAWKEVFAARASVNWLRGPMRDYVDLLETLK